MMRFWKSKRKKSVSIEAHTNELLIADCDSKARFMNYNVEKDEASV